MSNDNNADGHIVGNWFNDLPNIAHAEGVARNGSANPMAATVVRSTLSATYNPVTEEISIGGGTPVSGNAMPTAQEIDWSQVEVPDDGRDLGESWDRYVAEYKAFEERVNRITHYDRDTGKPVYYMSDRERSDMQDVLKRKANHLVELKNELDVLAAQRQRRAAIKVELDKQQAQREERVARYTAEELERLEARERAAEIHESARRQRRNSWG